MRTLLLACGNTLRGDDAAAHAVLDLIAPTSLHATRAVHQLTPELAPEVARFSRVVFIDADAESKAVRIEPLNAAPQNLISQGSPLTHASTPEEVVALASALFGFSGQAFVCRIPAQHFDAGEAPAPEVLQFAREAASQIARLI
jgi:hydrogenase maturation protease